MLLLQCTVGAAAVPGITLSSAGYFAGHRSADLPQTGEAVSRIQLPFTADSALLQRRGGFAWAGTDLALDAAPDDAWQAMLYASGTVALYVNGARITASPADPGPSPDPRFVPLRFDIPPGLLHAGHNPVLIRIEATDAGLALSSVVVGPWQEVEPRYHHRLWIDSTGAKVATLAVIGIADFFLVLWRHRRKAAIHGWFGLSCALWALLILALHTSPAPCAAILVPGLAAGIGFTGWSMGPVWRKPDAVGFSLWLSCSVVLACAACDIALAYGLRPWPAVRVMPYGAAFYAATVGWALIKQVIHDYNASERIRIELEARAQEREEALSLRYAAAAALDRKLAATTERERFLAEVHEGLGAYLRQSRQLTSIGQLTSATATDLLRGAMNELRIAIESSRPGARDLLMMLGSQRYRMESRLRRAGITLDWAVCDNLPAAGLSPGITADISRIAYEAFTNCIKHSGASRLSVSVRFDPPAGVELEIADNGRGFDVDAHKEGRGLRNMHRLAARMGATLSLSSAPGATRLSLKL